jgi:hypothetical protein
MPELIAFAAVGVALGVVAIATEWFDFGQSEQRAAAPMAPIAQSVSPAQQPQLAQAISRAEASSHRSAAPAGRAGWQWQSDGVKPVR